MPTVREVLTSGITKIVAQPASQPGDVFPSGVILQFAGSAAPTNWLICDGTAVSRATFSALFGVIGTTYGAGDGSTTFNLPDLRDKVPVGKSGTKALGSTGGSATHAISIAEMPAHNHGGATLANSTGIFLQLDGVHTHVYQITGTGAQVGTFAAGAQGAITTTATASGGSHTHGVSDPSHAHAISSQGSGTAMSLLQPYLAVNHIIKT